MHPIVEIGTLKGDLTSSSVPNTLAHMASSISALAISVHRASGAPYSLRVALHPRWGIANKSPLFAMNQFQWQHCVWLGHSRIWCYQERMQDAVSLRTACSMHVLSRPLAFFVWTLLILNSSTAPRSYGLPLADSCCEWVIIPHWAALIGWPHGH